MAQTPNPFDPQPAGRFKSAPKTPEQEAAAAEAAGESVDFILGIHINTIFFVVAAVIAVLWFTVGGGRKAKVTRN